MIAMVKLSPQEVEALEKARRAVVPGQISLFGGGAAKPTTAKVSAPKAVVKPAPKAVVKLSAAEAEKVKNPGSRGGKGYRDDKGEWRYGEKGESSKPKKPYKAPSVKSGPSPHIKERADKAIEQYKAAQAAWRDSEIEKYKRQMQGEASISKRESMKLQMRALGSERELKTALLEWHKVKDPQKSDKERERSVNSEIYAIAHEYQGDYQATAKQQLQDEYNAKLQEGRRKADEAAAAAEAKQAEAMRRYRESKVATRKTRNKDDLQRLRSPDHATPSQIPPGASDHPR